MIKINRFKGYRFRRYSFGLKILAAIWLFISVMVFVAAPSWLSFAAALCSAVLSAPALLLAAACDEIAERAFEMAKG